MKFLLITILNCSFILNFVQANTCISFLSTPKGKIVLKDSLETSNFKPPIIRAPEAIKSIFLGNSPKRGLNLIKKRFSIPGQGSPAVEFQGVRILDLSGANLVDPELIYISQHATDTKVISLEGNGKISKRSFIELLKNVRDLREINTHLVGIPATEILDLLIKYQPDISSLIIDSIPPWAIKKLLKLKNLKKLTYYDQGSFRSSNSRLQYSLTEGDLIRLINQHPSLRALRAPPFQQRRSRHFFDRNYQDLIEALDAKDINYRFHSFYDLKSQGQDFVVVDGDTLKLLPPGSNLENYVSLRIVGIDTPEKKITNKTKQEYRSTIKIQNPELTKKEVEDMLDEWVNNEETLSKTATQFMHHLLKTSSEVRVTHIGPDKYGQRVLVSVFIKRKGDWFNIADYMVHNRLAVPYYGEKKEAFDWGVYSKE